MGGGYIELGTVTTVPNPVLQFTIWKNPFNILFLGL